MRKIACVTLLLIISCLVARPLSAYILQKGIAQDGSIVGLRWDTSAFPIPWELNGTQGTNVTGSRSFASVVQQSFQSWVGVSTAKISFAQGVNSSNKPGYDQVNLVTTAVNAADWASYGVGAETLAFTQTSWFNVGGAQDQFGRPVNFPGQILEGDIIFNPGFAFSTEPTVPALQTDLQAVLTHEIGHFLGLDHTNLMSSTMFWTTSVGVSYPRTLSADDATGISALYPTAAFTSSTGTMSGTVRLTSNKVVFGALVVVVNSSGQPVASTFTDTNGKYSIAGLPTGSYSVYAEPLDGPLNESSVYSLFRLDPSSSINLNFTTRFH